MFFGPPAPGKNLFSSRKMTSIGSAGLSGAKRLFCCTCGSGACCSSVGPNPQVFFPFLLLSKFALTNLFIDSWPTYEPQVEEWQVGIPLFCPLVGAKCKAVHVPLTTGIEKCSISNSSSFLYLWNWFLLVHLKFWRSEVCTLAFDEVNRNRWDCEGANFLTLRSAPLPIQLLVSRTRKRNNRPQLVYSMNFPIFFMFITFIHI